MEVYWFSGSAPSWRVLLTLELKGVAYTSKLIQAFKGEHKSPEYMALNPRGKVPTLRDGDLVLPESLAIMAYLDRKFPEPPLFGRSPEEAGRIWKAVMDSELYLQPAALGIILPIFLGQTEEKADRVKAAIPDVHAELRALETIVKGNEWLVGDAISAADIATYPFLEALLRAAGKETAAPFELGLLPLGGRYPALEAWRQRITALPGYDRTYPPHWRDAA